MRFLIDAQLPPSLAHLLRTHGHDAVHLFDVAPKNADDTLVWNLAIKDGRVIVTKDEDFASRSKLAPAGPQIVWLRVGNCGKTELRDWLEPLLSSIIEALEKGDRLVVVLR